MPKVNTSVKKNKNSLPPLQEWPHSGKINFTIDKDPFQLPETWYANYLENQVNETEDKLMA